jgi:hypothetical protein
MQIRKFFFPNHMWKYFQVQILSRWKKIDRDECMTWLRFFIYPPAILPRFGILPKYPVSDESDTGAGAIHVRYAPDTPTSVSEYPDNFNTSRYAPDTPPIHLWYVHDILFQGILMDSVKNTRPILVDMPRYSSDTLLIPPWVKFISCHLYCYNISVIYISIEYNNFFPTLFII